MGFLRRLLGGGRPERRDLPYREVWSAPFGGPVTLRADDGSLRLGFDLTTSGEPMIGIEFNHVRAYRWRADGHFTPRHLPAHKLLEVDGSPWAAKLSAPPMRASWPIRHFMICFGDEGGCFEVAAESWARLPSPLGLDGRPLDTGQG